jgi:phage/plasmid-like protein (TIGR03299 family)
MAHDIYYNTATQKHSMFSRKKLPWHKLGQIIDKDIVTAKEAMIAAQADFEVIKAPAHVEVKPGMFKGSNTHFLTYRSDTLDILGHVGPDYTVVQNADAFDFIDSIIMGGEASFETAGVLNFGERIFVTAKLPSHVKLGGEDIIDKYIFLTNSHDGTGRILAAITPIRIVCNNTLRMALANRQNTVAFKHTRKVHEKLEMAHKLMGLTNSYYDEFQTLMDTLKGIPMGKENVTKAACKIFLSPNDYECVKAVNFNYERSRDISTRKANVITTVLNSIDQGVGQNYHRGTALWVLNGITTYFQNARDYRSDLTKLDALSDNKYSEMLTNGTKVLLKNLY